MSGDPTQFHGGELELTAISSDPLAAALLEIAELNERLIALEADLDTVCEGHRRLYDLYQRTLHRAERAEAQLTTVAPMVNGKDAIVISCSVGGCLHLPISRKVLPPEDAIPQWLAGLDWGYTADGQAYLCPEHRSR